MVLGDGATKIQVVRYKQAGFTLYSGTMTVGQLLNHGFTTEWDPGKGWTLEDQGYQRIHRPDHWRAIALFLQREKDPLLPTNALLASRNREFGELHFDQIVDSFGYLHIPEGRSLYIVDYQHRWRGFEHAVQILKEESLRNVTIPVTIMSDTTLYEETKQFFLINSKQKRVDTDLALTLMNAMASDSDEDELANLVGPGNKFKIRGTRLVVQIAQLESGPWVGKIQEPNNPGNPLQIAAIKSFVDSLRPIVSTRSPIHKFSDDEVIDIISAIWEGILNLWPEWRDNFQRFAVQRANGLFVFHRVASQLLIPKMITLNDRSHELVTKTLTGVRPYLEQDFWRIGGGAGAYSSGAGHAELAKQIINSAP